MRISRDNQTIVEIVVNSRDGGITLLKGICKKRTKYDVEKYQCNIGVIKIKMDFNCSSK